MIDITVTAFSLMANLVLFTVWMMERDRRKEAQDTTEIWRRQYVEASEQSHRLVMAIAERRDHVAG